MQWFKVAYILVGLSVLSGCSNWIYRMSIPQGNFLEQKDVDRLRIQMTKEQVLYVLGKPVASNAFDKNKWQYLYLFNPGRSDEQRTSLTVHFKDGKLVDIEGDYEKPAEFNSAIDG